VAVRGSAHVQSDKPCQDAWAARLRDGPEGEVLILAASDGAGSAHRAEDGARACVDRFVAELEHWLAADPTLATLDEPAARDVARRMVETLRQQAAEADASPRDYACTLLGAVVTAEVACFWQRGDGFMLRERDGRYEPIFPPDRGQYVNETGFITDADAVEALHFLRLDERIDQLAMLTDGLEPVTIVARTGLGFERFFAPLFARLARSDPGWREELAHQLAGLLDDPRVNAKTGDDKTLLLVIREGAPAVENAPLVETGSSGEPEPSGTKESSSESEPSGEPEPPSSPLHQTSRSSGWGERRLRRIHQQTLL
jgi:hypothetical protein